MPFLYFILFSSIFSSIHNRCPNEEIRDNRPILDTYYESPSGHFWIHYDFSGDNAPNLTDDNNNNIPDYVEAAAEAADSARFILTQEMGYMDEENDSDGKYDIYILELSSSLWGNCQSESSGGSFIRIRNTYEGMSEFCDDEKELLWLTVGHEFFHAVQYAYRSNSNDSYFRELTSMWFENIFVPNCFDFLNFVDNGISSLFNNPEKGFDDNTSGQVGYSLALYGHYLSTIIDYNDFEDQTPSTIMREIWEDYSEGGTVFSSLKNVLESNLYNTTFSETWVDFMSRNMFCGKYNNMDNDIYYHIAQSYISPPSIEYQPLVGNSIIESEIYIDDDRVSIIPYQAMDQYRINAQFQSSSELWNGYLLKNNLMANISNAESYDFFSINDLDELILIFSNENNAGNINYTFNVNIEGCMEYNAINYNPNAVLDDGSCDFPVSSSLISVYPNPINSASSPFNIIYDQVSNGEIILEVFDIKGRLISKKTFLIPSGRQYINYNIDTSISSGIYFLRISSYNNTEIIKFVNIR